MRVLCVFGQHAYGDEARGLSPEYQAFVPALSRAGHEVVFFDSWNRRAFTDLAQLNMELLRTIEEHRPEVLLFVPFLYEVWLETLFAIKNRGDITSICWTTDDSWKYERQSRFLAPAFHLITTTYPESFRKYQAEGFPVLLTQWAAPADALAPPLRAVDCRFPVSFVGMMHGDRRERLERLAERGIHVESFGYGSVNGPVSVARMREIVRSSVISLNFANSHGDKQIKARTFEVPGAGGFLLTEDAPRLERFYRLGEEMDSFSDDDELEAKIRQYLADPERRDAMAMRGFERTRDEHTYDSRLREIFAAAREAKRFAAPSSDPIFPTMDAAFRTHRVKLRHRVLRSFLVACASLAIGRRRARRAARRFLFEVSWRLFGKKTYMAAGLPGRLFPND